MEHSLKKENYENGTSLYKQHEYFKLKAKFEQLKRRYYELVDEKELRIRSLHSNFIERVKELKRLRKQSLICDNHEDVTKYRMLLKSVRDQYEIDCEATQKLYNDRITQKKREAFECKKMFDNANKLLMDDNKEVTVINDSK